MTGAPFFIRSHIFSGWLHMKHAQYFFAALNSNTSKKRQLCNSCIKMSWSCKKRKIIWFPGTIKIISNFVDGQIFTELCDFLYEYWGKKIKFDNSLRIKICWLGVSMKSTKSKPPWIHVRIISPYISKFVPGNVFLY